MDALGEGAATQGADTASADLLAAARIADAQPAPEAGPGVPAAPPVDPRKQWTDFALGIGKMARDAHPICAAEWTDDKLRAFGEALADCAQRYGWKSTGALVGHPLVTLAVASVPLAWPFLAPHVLAWVQKSKPAAPAGAPQ